RARLGDDRARHPRGTWSCQLSEAAVPPLRTRIGLDLDNTLVCYDAVFSRLAVERGFIDPGAPVSKLAVRELLRGSGREDAWTELQGAAYGARMCEAEPFPGVLQLLVKA